MIELLSTAGMGGRSSDSYDDLKEMLFTDSAVAGKAVSDAMILWCWDLQIREDTNISKRDTPREDHSQPSAW